MDGWHPNHYPQHRYPPQNADMAHGMALGAMTAQIERLIYISELHGQLLTQLRDLSVALGAAVVRLEARPIPAVCPHPVAPAKETEKVEKMAWRDKLQLLVFLAAIIGAMLGKLPWEKVFSFGKPLGY